MKIAAEAELETVVEVQIDEGVQNVDRPAQPPVDRKLVLDPLGDVAVEEDPLAGQEDAAICRHLVALTPDPCVNLRLKMHSKPEFVVRRRPLEAGAEGAHERHPLGAGDIRERVSRRGRVGIKLPLGVVRYGRVGVGRRRPVHGRRRSGDVGALLHRVVLGVTRVDSKAPRISREAASSARHAPCWSSQAARRASCSFPPSPAAARPVVPPRSGAAAGAADGAVEEGSGAGRSSCDQALGHNAAKAPHKPSVDCQELGLCMRDRTRVQLLARDVPGRRR